MKTITLCIVVCLLSIGGIAQLFSISGTITDSITQQPITGVTIYLSNTTIATTTNNHGYFKLEKLPAGKHELVLSHIGYRTISHEIDGSEQSLNFQLSPQSTMLDEVVVTNSKLQLQSWAKWGDLFMSRVVGNSLYAINCSLENKKAVQFYYSKKRQLLIARTSAPLIIVNPSLGYRIHYSINRFEWSKSKQQTIAAGTLLYEEMNGDSLQRSVWNINRQNLYKVSLLRFMRSVYANNLQQDGYLLRKAIAAGLADTVQMIDNTLVFDKAMGYMGAVLKLQVSNEMLPPDSFAGVNEAGVVTVHPKDIISVQLADSLYAPEQVMDYLRSPTAGLTNISFSANEISRVINRISSILLVKQSKPVTVEPNGYYHNSADLWVDGFFSWFEKVATMLPLDYYP